MWLSKKEYEVLTDKLDSLWNNYRRLSEEIRSLDEKQWKLEHRIERIRTKGVNEKELPDRSVELSDGSIMESYEYKELVNDILGVTSSYGLAVGDLKFIFELISRDAGDRTIPV